MKNILLISTGGTIACAETGAGLSPVSPETALAKLADYIPADVKLDVKTPFFLDSTDIKPSHWQTVSRIIYENYDKYDGFAITHGTDTMQYTAAVLSFMLKNLTKPVVLTGSMLPLSSENTDGYKNFSDALALAASGKSGVWIAFGGRTISGAGAYKRHSTALDAFMGTDTRVLSENAKPLILREKLCESVFLLKLTPNIKPGIFDYIKQNYKGLVLEGFGLGGIPSDFLPAITEVIENGVRVIFVTACQEGGADLNVYSVGMNAKKLGIEDGKNLTPSAAVTKLMVELGNTEDFDDKKI